MFQTLDNPSYLAINRDQTVLYTVHGDGTQVSAFAIDPAAGRLSLLNARSCEGRNPVHLALTKDGRGLVVANYATGSVVRLAIESDGAIGKPLGSTQLEGMLGPRQADQASSHPHQISRYTNVLHDSDWHIVPDKALDAVFAVRWPGEGAAQVVENRWRPGSGPRHAAFHPTLPLVYVANELDSTMTTWRFDVDSGALESLDTIMLLPGGFAGESSAAGIVITPSGNQLLVSNRGHDSVASVRLDPVTGYPLSIEWTRTYGKFPRFICLSPNGKHLYVANERSDSIIQYALDDAHEKPTATGQVIETGSPVCIVFKTG
ncbi:lactonase family protein [Pandoraea terrae]